ncbi:hypothetical protein BLNAU_19252 [Blattamonas nauphoetae]|uniref:DUF676 domain-containing protein n=1 Tax=Blattamonas nauphoetae TaxID=2049346 RepID=A0ABQ9X222_9EUKA|nr:hypothetical protein BLNAU_19252 [Blattamonas nauphoetae]
MARHGTYPFILVHGAVRFDILWIKYLPRDYPRFMDSLVYMGHLARVLKDQGFNVESVQMRWASGTRSEAEILHASVLDVLKRYNADKVHLICHSYGGIVTRHMLWNYQNEKISDHIASVSTFSTPHLGLSISDSLLSSPIGVAYRRFLSHQTNPIPLKSLSCPMVRRRPVPQPTLSFPSFASLFSTEMKDSTNPRSNPNSPSPLPFDRRTNANGNTPTQSSARNVYSPHPNIANEANQTTPEQIWNNHLSPLPTLTPSKDTTTNAVTPIQNFSPQSSDSTPSSTTNQILPSARSPSAATRKQPLSNSLFLESLQPAVFNPASPTFGIVYPPSRPTRAFCFCGIDVSCLVDMLPLHCQAFDKQVEEFERGLNIKWRTFAADPDLPFPQLFPKPGRHSDDDKSASHTSKKQVHPPRSDAARIIARDGPYDGFVSVESAVWREEYLATSTIPLTHLEVTGLTSPAALLFPKSRSAQKLDAMKNLWLDLANIIANEFPVTEKQTIVQKYQPKRRHFVSIASSKHLFNHSPPRTLSSLQSSLLLLLTVFLVLFVLLIVSFSH